MLQDTEYKDKMQKKAQAQDYLTQWKKYRYDLICGFAVSLLSP